MIWYYIPSSNLFLKLKQAMFVLNRDETMMKLRCNPFDGAFLGLEISKYVEYLTRVSSEYLISCVLPSLTSTTGWASRVPLAYVIRWINKASLYSMNHAYSTACCATTDLKFGSCTVLSSSSVMEALKLITIKVRSRSWTLSLHQHAASM